MCQSLCIKQQIIYDYRVPKAQPAQDVKTDEDHLEKKVTQVKKSMDEEGKGSKTAVNGNANDDDITPVTRDQQLRLKNATKGSRTKADGKVSPKNKKGKRSKRNGKKKKVSAKRRILEKAKSQEFDVEPAQKKRRTLRSSGSKDGKKTNTGPQGASACPDPSGHSPDDEKKPKAKAKCKATPKRKAEAKSKVKAPKGKAAAKAKCAPKRKAAPAPKAEGKGKGQREIKETTWR